MVYLISRGGALGEAVADEVGACWQRCLRLYPIGQPSAQVPGQLNRQLMQTRTAFFCLRLLRCCHLAASCGSQIGSFAQD